MSTAVCKVQCVISSLLEDIDISISFLKDDQMSLCDALNDASITRLQYIAVLKHWVRLRRELDELMEERRTLLDLDECEMPIFTYKDLL